MAARLRRTPGRRAASGGEGGAPARRFIGCAGSSAQARWLMARTGREARSEVGGGGELGGLEAEAVHAAVELQRAGAAGADRAAKSRDLRGAVEAGDEVVGAAERRRRRASGRRRRRSPGRGRAPRAARRPPRRGRRRSCGRRRRRGRAPTRGGAEAVGVGLDHGGGLDRAAPSSASSARQLAAMASRSMVRRARAMAAAPSRAEGRSRRGPHPRRRGQAPAAAALSHPVRDVCMVGGGFAGAAAAGGADERERRGATPRPRRRPRR